MLNPILTHTEIALIIFLLVTLSFWGMTGATGSLFNEQKFCTLTDLESPFLLAAQLICQLLLVLRHLVIQL